jgi:copper chaperone CopZ
MSRRRGEFEHRTSIFEGAFRAWSHLGGLSPEDLETKPVAELDPLTNPIQDDPRLKDPKTSGVTGQSKNPDGTARREYPYEPLPRSGLAHPYVQAILSPWLGPDADNEAIQLGLTTLRTWWQHRRKGESGSAIASLGTEKMKGVVEGYTRHFFTLAHCIVVNDKVQPPRGLHTRMKELEKQRAKQNKKRGRAAGDDNSGGSLLAGSTGSGGGGGILPNLSTTAAASSFVEHINNDLNDPNLTPLEKLHMAQQRQLNMATMAASAEQGSVINLKGKCIPGKIDLPGVVDAVNNKARQLAYSGSGVTPLAVGSSSGSSTSFQAYGDPTKTPVVFVSGQGDIHVALKVDGITCAHCVKIVETVLRGCNGNRSPITGLLDAAADQELVSVLIKIDSPSNAKRIAFEAARNLSMVGYTAHIKEMDIIGDDGKDMDLGALASAFEHVGMTSGVNIFDWNIPCACPDNGIQRGDCSRYVSFVELADDQFGVNTLSHFWLFLSL